MERPTVLVLGTRRTDNMPSLTRMLEILREPVSGMHVEAPRATAHVTTTPVMKEDAAR